MTGLLLQRRSYSHRREAAYSECPQGIVEGMLAYFHTSGEEKDPSWRELHKEAPTRKQIALNTSCPNKTLTKQFTVLQLFPLGFSDPEAARK